MTYAVLALGMFVAYANGSNDVSKGIATLVGSGIADARSAVHWGVAWTALGAAFASLVAGAMVTAFGRGLLAPGVVPTLDAGLATMAGAAGWVLVATRAALPVSTTHAVVGAFAGVAASAYGVHGLRWSVLGAKIAVPLVLSPVVSLALTMVLARLSRRSTDRRADCACIEAEKPVLLPSGGVASLAMSQVTLHVTTGATADCRARPAVVARLDLERLHWFSSGLTSFARGLNDAPKLVALMIGASALTAGQTPPALAFVLVASAMATGGLVGGKRVTRTLAEKVTVIEPRGGFVANAVTATLVAAGAVLGWPMSTTHVSTGAIIGTGIEQRTLRLRAARDLAIAWLVTAPAAATLGVLFYYALASLHP